MIDLIFLLQADLDIQTAYNRFEEVQSGRGEVFMRQLDTALTLLRTHPKMRLYMQDRTAECLSVIFPMEYFIRHGLGASWWLPLSIFGKIQTQFGASCWEVTEVG